MARTANKGLCLGFLEALGGIVCLFQSAFWMLAGRDGGMRRYVTLFLCVPSSRLHILVLGRIRKLELQDLQLILVDIATVMYHVPI